MVSEISSLRGSFGKFTESLPDEIFAHKTQAEIEELNKKLLKILNDDHEFIKSLARRRKGSNAILNKMLRSRAYFVKKAFVRYKEYDTVNEDPLGYLLSHWLLCRGTLERISTVMLQELQNTRQMNSEYNRPGVDDHGKRSAYIRFTRAYQAFLGCAVNILDVIQEYEDSFNSASKKMDPTHRFTGGSRSAWIYDYEIITGAYELLLRANLGRFTCAPLIREAIEIKLSRLFLDPPARSKFNGRKLIPIGRFDIIADFLTKYASILGITLQGLDVDALSRIYDWGSIVLHKGWRMNHCEMWYALSIAESLHAFIRIDKTRFDRNFDDVIEKLVKLRQIKVEK